MKLDMSFQHVDSTEAIKNTISKKVRRLEKFLTPTSHVDWKCIVDNQTHESHVTITQKGGQIFAKATDSDMYKTFDEVIIKLEKQLAKAKGDTKIHRG